MENTVLCIDPTPEILQGCKKFFEDRGYRVVSTESVQEGLALIDRHPVDCVILNYEIRETDGEAVVLYMRHHELHPPVILVSGSDLSREFREQEDASLERTIQSPELLQWVESLVRNGQKSRTTSTYSAGQESEE